MFSRLCLTYTLRTANLHFKKSYLGKVGLRGNTKLVSQNKVKYSYFGQAVVVIYLVGIST